MKKELGEKQKEEKRKKKKQQANGQKKKEEKKRKKRKERVKKKLNFLFNRCMNHGLENIHSHFLLHRGDSSTTNDRIPLVDSCDRNCDTTKFDSKCLIVEVKEHYSRDGINDSIYALWNEGTRRRGGDALSWIK